MLFIRLELQCYAPNELVPKEVHYILVLLYIHFIHKTGTRMLYYAPNELVPKEVHYILVLLYIHVGSYI